MFSNVQYYSFSELSTTVPIVSVGGLAKMYVSPGWRLGWVIVHDRGNVMQEVCCFSKERLFRLSPYVRVQYFSYFTELFTSYLCDCCQQAERF